MYSFVLTEEQRDRVILLISNKVNEVHHWRIATGKQHRDEEYLKTCELLKVFTYTMEEIACQKKSKL